MPTIIDKFKKVFPDVEVVSPEEAEKLLQDYRERYPETQTAYKREVAKQPRKKPRAKRTKAKAKPVPATTMTRARRSMIYQGALSSTSVGVVLASQNLVDRILAQLDKRRQP